jgi:hypothetical protein
MKMSNFYTINELNYKSIEESLPNSNLPPQVLQTIRALIADHKAIVECKKKIIAEQSALATALFSIFSEPEPQVLPQDENKGSEPLPDSAQNPSFSSDNPQESPEKKEPQPSGKLKKGKRKLPLGKVTSHPIPESERNCSSCGSKMHKQLSKVRTYVVSLPLFQSETHVSESCRCLKCNTSYTAPNPIEKQSIGRYHFSSVSSLAALRYQYGMASYRMESMSDAVGIQIPDSTQWHLFEQAATLVRPFVAFLEKTVANAPVQHVDDTYNTVLSIVKSIEQEQEAARFQGKNPNTVRSGIHTTNLTGVFPQGQIVLYKTGLHHSGEILAKILDRRTKLDEQVIIMVDAASTNPSKINLKNNPNFKIATCNSHAARKFIELDEQEKEILKKYSPKEYQTSELLHYFLFRYKTVFKNDQHTKNEKLTPNERLLFHKENSLPLMKEMKENAEKIIANKEVEPNSDIGKALQYLINHYSKFTAFCLLENAPICNNLSERMLKTIIRHRKNSLFFKNQLGARVADIITTILFSAKANNINSVEYLKNLMIHKNLWEQEPQKWLPWNYTATIEAIHPNKI